MEKQTARLLKDANSHSVRHTNTHWEPRYFSRGGQCSTFAAVLPFQFLSVDGYFPLMLTYISIILRIILSAPKKSLSNSASSKLPWSCSTLGRELFKPQLPSSCSLCLASSDHLQWNQLPGSYGCIWAARSDWSSVPSSCTHRAALLNCDPDKALAWSNGVHAQRCGYSLLLLYWG